MLSAALLLWYEFQPESPILYIGRENDGLAEACRYRGLQTVCVDIPSVLAGGQIQKRQFPYVVLSSAFEAHEDCERLLRGCRNALTPDGRLLLAMNNRLGLRYFCGDRDPYTGRNFDGIENYRRAYVTKEDGFAGRMYSKSEMQTVLRRAGFAKSQFFSVLPGLESPSLIYAEDCLPNEDLANRLFPVYHWPDTVFLEEEALYQGLIENGMFHQMSNAYLAECTAEGEMSDVSHVTVSMERGRENALLTVLHKSGRAEKRAIYPEGRERLVQLFENGEKLKARGLSVVNAALEKDAYCMPVVQAESGQLYLKRLLLSDRQSFFQAMDHFRDLILQSSDIVSPDRGDGEGAVLREGYLDLVPLNSFYQNGTFLFYDQEFCVEQYPVNALLWRMVATFYAGNMEFHKILPMEELLERYGLKPKLRKWQELEWRFLTELRREEELRLFHEKYRRSSDIVNANRQKVNYSEMEYQAVFVDIFRGLENKRLILFGSGTFARHFLTMYGRDYPAYAIVDNNQARWGQTVEGVKVYAPDWLRQLEPEEYKVIICIRNYLSVWKQLQDMGVRSCSIYDAGKSYPFRHEVRVERRETDEKEPRRYHTGYVAGVFDMFHVGHVNLLRRAREQCDYLIVGVLPDKEVYRQKKKYPVIPCEDRVEVIRACRYADRVEALPEGCAGIRDAYRLFQFDCQFSGDDHREAVSWLADRQFLEKNGAEIMFLPYTEKESSTKIRERLK